MFNLQFSVLLILGIVFFICSVSCPDNGHFKSKKASPDSIITLKSRQNVTDTSIVNYSELRVDILFNGIYGFLGGKKNDNVFFDTECMQCEHVQVFNGGLLFGKRLYISDEKILYYRKELRISDNASRVETVNFFGNKKRKKFKFKGGRGIFTFTEQSCEDADLVRVNLKYEEKEVEIRQVLNAFFFEYDLDRDGKNEQYLIGTRNCTQELVVLRVHGNEHN